MFSSIYFIGSPSQLSFLSTDLLFSTFNPADYTANSGTRQETWEGDGNEPAEGTGKEIDGTYIVRKLQTFAMDWLISTVLIPFKSILILCSLALNWVVPISCY